MSRILLTQASRHVWSRLTFDVGQMKTLMARILTVIGGVTVLGSFLWLLSLTPIWKAATLTFEITYEELPRVVSPDGAFEIVTIRGNGGATTSYSYEIFVVPKGEASQPTVSENFS